MPRQSHTNHSSDAIISLISKKSLFFRPAESHIAGFVEQKPTQISSCVLGEFCGPTAGKQSRVSRYHTLHLFFLWGSWLLISASLDEKSCLSILPPAEWLSLHDYRKTHGHEWLLPVPRLHDVPALLPISIPLVSFYDSSNFEERECDCSPANR